MAFRGLGPNFPRYRALPPRKWTFYTKNGCFVHKMDVFDFCWRFPVLQVHDACPGPVLRRPRQRCFQGSEFRVQGSGFRLRASGLGIRGSGFRVQGSGFGVQGSGFGIRGSGFRVQGSGFGVQGSGFRIRGSGFRI